MKFAFAREHHSF